VILFEGRRSTLGVRAQRESLTGDLGWPVCIGEEREKREGGATGRWGQRARGRERKETCARAGAGGSWAGRGPRGGREEEGRGRWAAGEKGPAQEGERSRPGWADSFSLISFSFLFSN
jgi:hypothetical protein